MSSITAYFEGGPIDGERRALPEARRVITVHVAPRPQVFGQPPRPEAVNYELVSMNRKRGVAYYRHREGVGDEQR